MRGNFFIGDALVSLENRQTPRGEEIMFKWDAEANCVYLNSSINLKNSFLSG